MEDSSSLRRPRTSPDTCIAARYASACTHPSVCSLLLHRVRNPAGNGCPARRPHHPTQPNMLGRAAAVAQRRRLGRLMTRRSVIYRARKRNQPCARIIEPSRSRRWTGRQPAPADRERTTGRRGVSGRPGAHGCLPQPPLARSLGGIGSADEATREVGCRPAGRRLLRDRRRVPVPASTCPWIITY